ncbi:hypothetical protein E2562_029057 [Oryza meyeriana var. granulata]|uniref:Uncharacterized protein n=1 Tax=Oryza meyeriana var. granulata TaxID=110450 RepID=A0A6G1CUX0_9ORYZ|nr:hypothetical protein E2562_029057 [Oryza meyeriana var. granulata]
MQGIWLKPLDPHAAPPTRQCPSGKARGARSRATTRHRWRGARSAGNDVMSTARRGERGGGGRWSEDGDQWSEVNRREKSGKKSPN